jgi:tRNA(Arg) A34 adenosine deaminase TadA
MPELIGEPARVAAAGEPPKQRPEAVWSGLDAAWLEAFRQAWEAFRTGNIPVGACATTPDGAIVHAARNRVTDTDGPAGEAFGSALAHAEVNVLARLGYGQPRLVVLTTTLEPCIQCSAAIRLGPVAVVRYAGADPLWDGCHDFSPLSSREAARAKVTMAGPRADEVGMFGTLISRFGPGPVPGAASDFLRSAGQGSILDLVDRYQATGEAQRLAAMEVSEAFEYLWPQLRALRSAQVSS